MQEQLKKWFNEVSKVAPVHDTTNGRFVIYKGFKLGLFEEGYRLYDVRFSDMYSQPSSHSISIFEVAGFVKGCDQIRYHRDIKFVNQFTKKLEKFYNKRKHCQRIQLSLHRSERRHTGFPIGLQFCFLSICASEN